MAITGTSTSGGTVNSAITAFITQFHRQTLMPHVKYDSVLWGMADVEDMPKGRGTSVEVRRRLPLDVVEATTAEAAHPSPVAFDGMKISLNIVALTNAVQPSKLLKDTDFKRLLDMRDLVKDNMVESLERYAILQISPYLAHVRADFDAAYQKMITATGNGASDGTTVVSTGVTEANDYWGGDTGSKGWIVCTKRNSKNYGVATRITDSAINTSVTVSPAFPYQTVTGDTFMIVTGSTLTTDDVISMTNVRKITRNFKRWLIKGKSWSYPMPMGMGAKALLNSEDLHDMQADSEFKNVLQYNSRSDRYQQYRAGQILSNDMLDYSQEYREGANGVYAAAGAVYNSLFLMKHALIRLDLTAPHVEVVFGPDSTNFLNRYYTIAWEAEFAIGVQNALAGQTLLTVPSA